MIASAKEIDALNITLFNSCINFTNVHLCNYCTKIFIIVNACVCRRSVDNKALILSYPILSAQPRGGTPVPVHLSIIQTVEFRTPLLLPLYSMDNTVFIPGVPFYSTQIPEILVRKQMEQTILVRFGQNIWQHLLRWSTLDRPTGMTEMTLSIWHNCCHCYCSSVPCLQVPTQTHSGLGLTSVQLECSVPLGVWNFQNFEQEFLLNGTHHKARCGWHSSAVTWDDKRF